MTLRDHVGVLGVFFWLMIITARVAAAAATDATQPALGTIEVIARHEVLPPLPTDVIAAAALESAGRRDLAQALDLVPALTVTRVGARNEALVQLRGYDSRQVPLFVDGIPVYVPYDGNIDLARLGVGDVEEIRVSKAGGSVLYGPNALGGAINVVTARPAPGLNWEGRAGVRYDDSMDLARRDVGGRASWRNGEWYLQAFAFLRDENFFRIPGGDFGSAEDGGRRENSASRDLNTRIQLGWQSESGAEWQLNYARLDGDKQTPPYAGTDPGVRPRFWRWPYYDKEDIYVIGALPVGDGLWLRARAYYDSFENALHSFDDATYTTQNRPYAFTSNYDDYTWGSSLEAELAPGEAAGVTRAVFHFKEDVHREFDDLDQPQERMEDRTWSVAVEHTHTLRDNLSASAGVGWNKLDTRRADDNINGTITPFPLDDDSAVNVTAGAAWNVAPDWTLDLNLARKTRFPTLKDRYSYRLGAALPNPELTAEEAEHVEVGATTRLGGAELHGALFASWLDDAIASVSLPPTACTSPPCFQLQNVGRQRRRGGELSATTTDVPVLGELRLGYSYVAVDNFEQPEVRAVFTPRHKVQLGMRTPLGERVALRFDFKAEDGRLSTSDGVRRTAGFGLLDVGVEVRMIAGLRLLVEAANLTDRLYAYDEGFPESGRNYAATLLWQPGS
ncbi:MAG: TonB-dependent receptor [Gammaproteobacteria bacterium]|nr:MAG: TonB-dependent receptor [Gammaproteobacteria bacterium]